MKFCDVCDNMLYITLTPEPPPGSDGAGPAGRLQYSCKSCGNTILGADTDTKSLVVDTNYTDDQTTYQHFLTGYITHDPTLPHVRNIACPNDACTRPRAAPADVIYIKYDAENLRYIYPCTHCAHFWKSGADRAAAAAADDDE